MEAKAEYDSDHVPAQACHGATHVVDFNDIGCDEESDTDGRIPHNQANYLHDQVI